MQKERAAARFRGNSEQGKGRRLSLSILFHFDYVGWIVNILEATRAYESWLGRQTPLIQSDLRAKHQAMTESAFAFLRATFYRWAQLWPQTCPELAAVPPVLAVGDLHVENFGTWRDTEGRLIWGINDFDEAFRMPYAVDLVRLAASAQLAIGENHLSCGIAEACDAILEGYTESLQSGGRPMVLAEHNRWLRELANNKLRDPVGYWEKMSQIPGLTQLVPPGVKKLLTQCLPEPGLRYRFVHRRAGLGSLGRQRITLLCEWRGGMIAREAKPLVASAWAWDGRAAGAGKIWYDVILNQSVRVQDPFLALHGNWIIRRLSPLCSRIRLGDLPKQQDESRLLRGMGWETANVHLGGGRAVKAIAKDLARQPSRWLRKAAAAMTQATLREWEEWRKAA
jgi:hypothetical protein